MGWVVTRCLCLLILAHQPHCGTSDGIRSQRGFLTCCCCCCCCRCCCCCCCAVAPRQHLPHRTHQPLPQRHLPHSPQSHLHPHQALDPADHPVPTTTTIKMTMMTTMTMLMMDVITMVIITMMTTGTMTCTSSMAPGVLLTTPGQVVITARTTLLARITAGAFLVVTTPMDLVSLLGEPRCSLTYILCITCSTFTAAASLPLGSASLALHVVNSMFGGVVCANARPPVSC
jgi:hypothetical protein